MKISPSIDAIRHLFKIPITPNSSIDRFVYSYIYGETITLIDTGVAGGDKQIFETIRSSGRSPSDIALLLLTHSHPDHIGSANAIQQKTGCSIAAHPAERAWIEDVDRHQTITLAPETGSERLRKAIHKGLTDEQIVRTIELISAYRFRHLKLYFIIGLPTETASDIAAISELTKRIQHQLLKSRPRSRYPESITLSIKAFIPKPGTPFHWHAFEEISSLQAKLKQIKNSLKKEKKVAVTWDLPKWSYLQCLLSRGDRRVSKILMAAHALGGNFAQAYRQVDVNPDFYVYRQRSLDEVFPWDFIDHGVSKESLAEAYRAPDRVIGTYTISCVRAAGLLDDDFSPKGFPLAMDQHRAWF